MEFLVSDHPPENPVEGWSKPKKEGFALTLTSTH